MVLTPLVTGSGKREQEDGAAQALRPGQETSRGGHFGGGSCGWERPVSRGIQPSPSAFSLSQALEEDLNQKKREQEMFFKMNKETECPNPATPNKATKFFPYSSADAS